MKEVKEDVLDLVIKVKDGKLASNNFAEFKEYALGKVKPADKELVTAQDLTEAKDAIKLCEAMEARVANVITSIQHPKEINDVLTELARFGEQVRQVRLSINKRATKKAEDDKTQIVNDGYNKVLSVWNVSPAKHGFTVDRTIFLTAIKGKSSLDKMEEAVQLTVDAAILRIQGVEDNYQANLSAVEISEQTYPTSYPDKRLICLHPAEVVAQTIETREAKAKLAALEKAQREAAEKAKHEEDERLRIEKAEQDRIAAEKEEELKSESWPANLDSKPASEPVQPGSDQAPGTVKAGSHSNLETVQPTSPAPFTPPPAEDPFVADAGGFTMPPNGFTPAVHKPVPLYTLVVTLRTVDLPYKIREIQGLAGVKSVELKQE